jgi:glycosyltransferase involved in cell wall biosynthesis
MKKYGVKEDAFIPTRSGISINHEDFPNIGEQEIREILSVYGVPSDKKIYFGWGRATQYKRFDLMFSAAKTLDDSFFPVVITNGNLGELDAYRKQVINKGIIISNTKDRTLINALLKWEKTVCTCFFSENDAGSIAPMEAMLHAGATGPVVLTNGSGGYSELIQNNYNGFVTANRPEAISKAILEIAALSKTKRLDICKNAKKTILTKYDVEKCHAETMENIFPFLKQKDETD